MTARRSPMSFSAAWASPTSTYSGKSGGNVSCGAFDRYAVDSRKGFGNVGLLESRMTKRRRSSILQKRSDSPARVSMALARNPAHQDSLCLRVPIKQHDEIRDPPRKTAQMRIRHTSARYRYTFLPGDREVRRK